MSAAEHALAGLALSLIPDGTCLTARERTLQRKATPPSPEQTAETMAAIRAGGDPLGATFSLVRSPKARRELGATYTPKSIVDAMVAWAGNEAAEPVRIVDPGAGSGRYLIAAAARFPDAHLVGVELDPLAAMLLRANAAILGFADRLELLVDDYRNIGLPEVGGRTLFIGNPPYVRHHDIEPKWKDWFADSARSQGFKASKLAGLHVHFFVKTREIGRPGDFGAFITAAEWLDVNYGSVLRNMLADGLGGTAVHVIDPKAQVFDDAQSTGAITCFRMGNRPDRLLMRSVERMDALQPLSQGIEVDWKDIVPAPRWSHFVRHHEKGVEGIEVGELFRVHRGQVTGNNAAWVEHAMMKGLPEQYLYPTITRAKELISAGEVLAKVDHLKRVLDLPADLDVLSKSELKAVEKFLRWAKRAGVPDGWIASNRRAWWSINLRTPAPILSTYMARRPPTFVRNVAGARNLNIAHGLYPRQPMSEDDLRLVVAYLNGNVRLESGRTYAGGLVKFEPKELERLRIPPLQILHEQAAESLDGRRTGRRRRGSESHI